MKKKYKKKKKKMMEVPTAIMTTSVASSVGSNVLGKIGGTPATYGQQAMSTYTSYMPTVAHVGGAGMVMDELKKLKGKKKY